MDANECKSVLAMIPKCEKSHRVKHKDTYAASPALATMGTPISTNITYINTYPRRKHYIYDSHSIASRIDADYSILKGHAGDMYLILLLSSGDAHTEKLKNWMMRSRDGDGLSTVVVSLDAGERSLTVYRKTSGLESPCQNVAGDDMEHYLHMLIHNSGATVYCGPDLPLYSKLREQSRALLWIYHAHHSTPLVSVVPGDCTAQLLRCFPGNDGCTVVFEGMGNLIPEVDDASVTRSVRSYYSTLSVTLNSHGANGECFSCTHARSAVLRAYDVSAPEDGNVICICKSLV